MAWHQRKNANVGLRLLGLVLLTLGVMLGRRLFAVADPQAKFTLVAYLRGLLAFAGTSSGAALTLLGRHLFDQVELSARWKIHNRRGK